MKINIIYEDENIVAINKPAGLLMHKSTPSSEEKTLADWALENYPEVAEVGDLPRVAESRRANLRPGIVHRLDKDTSGIVVIARNQKTFEYLKNLFQNHEIKKTYRAIVCGNVEEGGVIDKPISLKSGTTKRTVFKGKMEKSAVTKYKTLKAFDDYSYIELYPKTGRTHQIRVHMASIHHPVAGDKLYGSKKDKYDGRQMLHAYSLELSTPSGERIKLTADLPEDFQEFLNNLEK